MNSQSQNRRTAPASPSRIIRYGSSILALLVLLTGVVWWRPNLVGAAIALTTPDPVTAAWEKARAAGSYHFTSDVLQKTIPVASIANVGRTSHTDAFHLEGQNDLRGQKLELTLWNQGGSVLNAASGVSLRTEGGKTFTRRGNEAWQESDNLTEGFAPQGDFLGYLVAIRHVSAGVGESRNGIRFTRYSFDIDGPAFANYMHEQMLAALRAKGELPPGVQLEPPAYYRAMTGSGELWVGANGLPLRQILNLRFPEQRDERVEASMTVDFAQYGAEQSGLLTLLRSGQWQGAWLVLPHRLPDLTGLWLALTVSAVAFVGLVYRRRRTVQIAIVVAVIVSQVAGPLLNTFTQVKFFDTYRAKAAAQDEKQATDQSVREIQSKGNTAPEFNADANPLNIVSSEQLSVNSGQWENSLQSPVSSLQAAALVTDPGTDTDHDGLTDFTEVRIGTSEVISDTDEDGLLDNLEVNGFSMGGQTWYANPDVIDSNNDGQSDVVEWGIDNSTALPQATPRDTDSDDLPDLFDPDNDNDGVPDRVDTAPFTKGAATYSDTNPLQLTINNLAANKPTFVDFQLRPQDPKNLWFAYNVLDWPQDSDGQVRDTDGQTYAEVAATQGRTTEASDANGDMKLLPMLEIRIPAASANLPSQAELTPFNISVNDFTADGATKVAYVPLTIVTDQLTGERVAFSGQMRYKPTGSWTVPHSVRLAWVVQALNDLPCDKTTDTSDDCQADGVRNNVPAVIQSYYDDWTLTGLSVHEENGASMAILYEDPAADDNKQDDAPLWGLTTALDQHFLAGRDENHDGVRDLRLSDFPARFDRDNNPSDAQRFDIPNILQVVTNTYTTGDEAAMATAMTETVKILNTTFKPVVTADNRVKPLLLFAEENNLRAVGLDQVVGGEGYATQSGATVSFNLAPTAASALPVTVNANLKWMAYCGADGNNVSWRPCTSDEYAGVIEGRYAKAPSLPDDTSPEEVPGRMMLALSYYFTLAGGFQAHVQEGPNIASSRYSLEGESETATRLRTGFHSVAPLSQIVMQSLIHLAIAAKAKDRSAVTITSQIKVTIKQLGVTYYQLQQAEAKLDAFLDTGDNPVVPTKAEIRAIKVPLTRTLPLHFARFAAAAPVGSAIMLLFNVLSQVPDVDVPTRAALGAIGAAVTIGVTIYLPAATASYLYKFSLDNWTADSKKPKPTLAKVLNQDLIQAKNMRIAFAVGLAVNVALIWGFFAYAAGTSGYAAGSPELNKAAAEAVASTMVSVLLAVLSATFVGTIIVGIITVIDLILNLVCELGVDALRIQGNFYGGACFSLTTSATKVLSYFLYNYDLMINTNRSDLVVTGVPDVALADPGQGFVPANTLTLTLPVTTTVVHKDPDPSIGIMINGYLYLFSPDNLRSSTFRYGLSKSGPATLPVDLNQMTTAWQHVGEDHKYVLTPMYHGVASTDPAPLGGFPLVQGINSSVPFSLTMNFAIPAYECWPMWIPGTPIVFPVCRTREFESATTTPFTMMKYDVFPNSLADFLALGTKAGGGVGQRWDARFPALHDADGDGMQGPLFNGLDPNDTAWDADGDGLSDRFELERRAAGVAYSPIQRDTDGDGLTDQQEAAIDTDPAVADTDNDGLKDGVEVRHQVAGANGTLTTDWAGGWQVTLNTTPAKTIWVSSDPFNADGDVDGLNDQAEKELAANSDPALRVDDQGVPYHPNVPNTPPLAVFTDSSALFGYVAPNERLSYTTTVVAHVPVEPGVLNVTVPASQNFTPAPLKLNFNPLTFSTSQTMTQGIAFTVQPGGSLPPLALLSTAQTRLQSSSGAAWVADPVVTGAPLGGFAAPASAQSTHLTAARADRQDSYLLSSLIAENQGVNTQSVPGDVRTYNLTSGATTIMENSQNTGSSYFLRGDTWPRVANNALGNTLAAWDHVDQCNTITFNWLKVVTAGADHVTSGIEPFLTQGATSSTNQIWRWDTGGGTPDMTSGQQRGPNAFGFPFTKSFCGSYPLYAWESDSTGDEPVGSQQIAAQSRPETRTLTLSGSGHTYEVNISLGVKDSYTIGGALLNADGAVQRAITFPRPPVTTDYKLEMRNPVVASNGDGFLVAYEVVINGLSTGLESDTYIAVQAFDRTGAPIGNSADRVYSLPPGSFVSGLTRLSMDMTWMGDRYGLVYKHERGNRIVYNDYASNGSSITHGLFLAFDSIASPNRSQTYAPKIAYNPFTGQWALLYFEGPNAEAWLRLYRSVTGPIANFRSFGTGLTQGVVAYHPVTRGWMVGWYNGSIQPTTGTKLTTYALTSDLQNLLPSASTFTLSASGFGATSLACPAPQSVAQVDLRLEELPGATTFSDVSGSTNNATCSGTACPAAGSSGAPNAPLSDYALHFDGVDDRLTINKSFANSFTAAYWVKATQNANNSVIVVDQGANAANGWTLSFDAGRPAFMVNTASYLVSPTRIDDNQWHFVAGTRNQTTGAMVLYVDGNQVASGTAGTNALTAFTNLLIGGDRSGNRTLNGQIDHLQLFPVAMGATTIRALYDRTLQSYCVASGTSANGTDIQWGKLSLRQPDLRGGRLSASGTLNLTVDNVAPVATVTSVTNNQVLGPDQVIGGTASDQGAGVGKVEVSINNGDWQLASGAATWSFSLAGLSGPVSIRARATDLVGNVGNPSAALNVTIDNAPPAVTITPPAGTIKPTKNASGQWQVPLSGTATDNTGVKAGSIVVHLTQTSGVGVAQTTQVASGSWTINYLLDPTLFDPTGSYTVTVQADDTVGNRATATPLVIRLDTTGPVAALSASDATRTAITQTVSIGGVVSDTNSIVGIDKLEIAFTPVEQIAALPGDSTSAEAEALLTRTWTPVTLAQRGAGVATTAWSVAIPTGLENIYQIDVRSTDMLGNVSISANLWRGMIDTRDPRVVTTATATGATYFDAASNQQMSEIRFVCAAVDRNLDEAAFVCPGEGLAEPVRSFDHTPALQALFPDLTLRTGLAISYTLWTTTTTPAATVRACDGFGRCAQATISAARAVAAAGVDSEAVTAAASAAAPGAPSAVIVNPTNGSFVAAGSALSVTVAAEAGGGLKDVTIKLDNATVQTLSFAQSPAITRTVRTVNVPIATEGAHTLVAQATAWDNSNQTTLFPVAFTLDQKAPSLTIDASAVTLTDTWQAQSGILRFNGNASDSIGLAAVQIREARLEGNRLGANGFTDATFGGGSWRVALPVADPEGRTLTITVRAIDRAGRITQLNQAIATLLSAADAPNTSISSGPANPSAANSATFVFSGTVSAVTFECQLDNSPYTPCASPASYIDLSKGGHLLRIRAIDSRGLPDLSPAEYPWTVNAGQPDATITGKPANPTTERTATFTFTGDATATRFECSLDSSAYAACTSPTQYSNLGNGEHTFQVRARTSANLAGAADRYVWTVLNAAPVANNQSVVVIPNQAKRITLTATDSDPLVYTIVTPPAHGVLSGLAPNLTYAPNTNYGGVDSFTFKVSDGLAESNVATVTLFVDNVPPVVTCSANPNRLWPPNHSLATIQATVTVADLHSGPAGFTLLSVTSNEPDKGLNKDDVPNDIQGWTLKMPNTTGQLRAERSDTGTGRIYTLTYQGQDVAGNTALCRTIVFVPHDQTQPLPPVPTATAADATAGTATDGTVALPEEQQPAGTADEATLTHQLFLPLVSADSAPVSEAPRSNESTGNDEQSQLSAPDSSSSETAAITDTTVLSGTQVTTPTLQATSTEVYGEAHTPTDGAASAAQQRPLFLPLVVQAQ